MKMVELKQEVERMIKIMEVLRGPDGCPWDKEQDYYSLEPYIIEEAYEVVEALQKRDLKLLKEELGDLLLQVVFQAQIGREKGDFDLTEVVKAINGKMIRRHPYVFRDKEKVSVDEQRQIWDEIKKKEKNKSEEVVVESILDNVSQSQTALNQAYEVQVKAADVGFDWDNVLAVFNKIEEELREVKDAAEENNRDNLTEELGDLLFAVVNLVRFYHVNPEIALLKSILKFKDRFRYIEERVRERGFDLENMSLKELDFFWEESKKEYK